MKYNTHIEELERRLNRFKEERDKIQNEHKGSELTHFTYWAGYELGYLKGKISEIENCIDELNENKEPLIEPELEKDVEKNLELLGYSSIDDYLCIDKKKQ